MVYELQAARQMQLEDALGCMIGNKSLQKVIIQ